MSPSDGQHVQQDMVSRQRAADASPLATAPNGYTPQQRQYPQTRCSSPLRDSRTWVQTQ
jgi:hypothetical protein